MSATSPKPTRRTRVIFVLGLVAILLMALLTREPGPEAPPITDTALVAMRPVEQRSPKHAASSECRECHEHNHATWFASYHRTMTQVVTPENTIADFSEQTVSFPDADQAFHLRTEAGRPWVSFAKPVSFFPLSQERRDKYPLVLATGSHHMQLYWFPVGNERTLALMPLAWLREEQRWIPRYAAFLAPPGDGFHPEMARWNETCIRCHTTYGSPEARPGYTFASTAAEFGISCEACHGPAAEHITWQRNVRLGQTNTAVADPILNPANLDSRRSAAVCGACHSVLDGDYPEAFPPGDTEALEPYLVRRDQVIARQDKALARMKERGEAAMASDPTFAQADNDMLDGTFWPDGHVRVAGREYNGLIESGCYQQGGITCLSCHDLHQSRNDPRPVQEWANDMMSYRKDGDQACVQCHQSREYASSTHTHHPAASTGSRCANCHMPHTSYGLLKAVRSHTIDSPSVASTIATGRTTACNLCHLDQTLDWTARHLTEWFGHARPELSPDQQSLADAPLTALTGDAAQRALIAWHMGWEPARKASGEDWLPPYLGALLKDKYGAVRFIAERSLRSLPGQQGLKFDFLASRGDLIRAADAIIDQWNNATNKVRSARPSVLLSPGGRLEMSRFEALRDQRDDRDIRLAE